MHAELRLGEIIETTQRRDAIHIAVAPVEAKQQLTPGQHVTADGTATGGLIGIVDPFLVGPVSAGQVFWLFLYPNTVTGLRHDWTHPAFKGIADASPKTMSRSEVWLRGYAVRVKPYDDPEEAYQNLLRDLRKGEMFYHGIDLHSRDDLIDEDELHEHAKNVLGYPVHLRSFSCSC